MTAGGIEHDAYASDEMSLRDYWAIARRRKWYVIVPVLFALGYSLASSMSTTPMFRAKADVLVQAAPVPGVVLSETGMTARTLNNELLRAQGSALKSSARAQVGEEPTLSVGLAQDRDADLFVFTATSRSAQRAADAANAYAATYVASRQADLAADFQSQAEVLQQQLDDAEKRLAESNEGAGAEELRVIIAGYRADIDEVQTAAKLAAESGASIVNVAAPPAGPYAPTPLRSAFLAIVLGLFVGIAAALVRDFTDNHIRTPEGLEQATGLPAAAVVPRLKGWKKAETHVVILEDSSSPQAEAYRSLRARIQFRRVDRQIRSLMVTSARPGEGKTTTSSNLAVAFAAAGENTVLVDLDMRRPRIHKFFELGNEHGMSTVLLGADLDSAIRPLSDVPNLSVIPAGPSTGEASEILQDDSLSEVFEKLKVLFDVVVVDTPPVLAVADPLTISHYCDGTLLVVSASGTDKRDAELAAGQLASVEAPMIGAVLNNYSAAATGYSYSYAYSEYKPTSNSSEGGAHRERDWVTDDGGQQQTASAEPPKLSRRQMRRLAKDGADVGSIGSNGAALPAEAHFAPADDVGAAWVDESGTVQGFVVDEIGFDTIGSANGAPEHLDSVHETTQWSDASEMTTEASPESQDVVGLTGPIELQAPNHNPSQVPVNGNHGYAGNEAADLQELLRAELRQARIEHVRDAETDGQVSVSPIEGSPHDQVAGRPNEG